MKKNNKENIIIGYFSGNIIHNNDIEMIKPALQKILREFKNIQILLVGEIKFPSFLKEFSSQIKYENLRDWKELPEIIANVDINIVPTQSNIYYEAKSENKWIEAALVKIPTIASNYGIFKNVIK